MTGADSAPAGRSSSAKGNSVTTSQGQFQVTKVRMHDDLLQEGLLKKDKKAASFVIIGEPDIALKVERLDPKTLRRAEVNASHQATVEIKGLDIYDPIKDEVKSRDVHDIAYWMVDSDYDGANFIVRQAFFCGGDKDEFDAWKKGLENLALLGAKKKAEKTLKIEIDEEAFARLYGHQSHPFPVKSGQQIAVRVISQIGEETTKVLDVKSLLSPASCLLHSETRSSVSACYARRAGGRNPPDQDAALLARSRFWAASRQKRVHGTARRRAAEIGWPVSSHTP